MADEQPQPPQGVHASISLRVADMPEVVSGLRREMAQLLREAALDEGPEVAAFANRIAAAFEVGNAEV